MPVSYHFQGCKALLRTVKRRYIKYHAFAFYEKIRSTKAWDVDAVSYADDMHTMDLDKEILGKDSDFRFWNHSSFSFSFSYWNITEEGILKIG